MKTKNLDLVIKAIELMEQGKTVYLGEGGLVTEFPIVRVEPCYVEIIDCYCSVKIKRTEPRHIQYSDYRKIPKKSFPSPDQLALIGRNLKRICKYIKIPKEYDQHYFWTNYRSHVGLGLTEVLTDGQCGWFIEVIAP